MPNVYMLSTYGEYGAEDVRMTLDRDKLPSMIREYYALPDGAKDWQIKGYPELSADAIAGLVGALAKFDADATLGPKGDNLQPGWGGIQLHVVELE